MKTTSILCLSACLVFTGCAGMTKLHNELTGQKAVLTLEVVGAIAEQTVTDAGKLYHDRLITAAQWSTISTFYDTRFQPVYRAEVEAVASAQNPASNNLLGLLNQLVSTAKAAQPTK